MLTVTPQAIEKLREILQQEGQPDSALRVIAMPNNHGGIQFMMTLDQEQTEDDTVLEEGGLRFLMDSYSRQFLDDATIDYVEELERAGFVISSPRFSHGGGCACGGNCDCGGH